MWLDIAPLVVSVFLYFLSHQLITARELTRPCYLHTLHMCYTVALPQELGKDVRCQPPAQNVPEPAKGWTVPEVENVRPLPPFPPNILARSPPLSRPRALAAPKKSENEADQWYLQRNRKGEEYNLNLSTGEAQFETPDWLKKYTTGGKGWTAPGISDTRYFSPTPNRYTHHSASRPRTPPTLPPIMSKRVHKAEKWSQGRDSNDKTYYFNKVTGKSQTETPDYLKKYSTK